MLASYAGDDHRMFRESREGLIQIPDARGQEPRQRVVHGNIPLTHDETEALLLKHRMSAIADR